MATPNTLPRDISLLRIAAQGLILATRADSALQAVDSLLAIQGQQPSAIAHAILARSPGRKSDVVAAFNRYELVRSWPMRGTIHVTSAADHHWLRTSLRHRYSSWIDATRRAGTTDDLVQRGADIALELITSRGPISRSELVNAWDANGLFSCAPQWIQAGERPKGGQRDQGVNPRHLIMRLHLDGVLAQGPVRAGEHLFFDASILPQPSRGVDDGVGVARGQEGHRSALAEIARRYALGHGPIDARDLARWTGLTLTASRDALENAAEMGQIDNEVPVVRLCVQKHGRRRLIPYKSGSSSDRILYARADWEALLSHRRSASAPLFLGAFDELHVGYADRTCLTDEAGEALICPAKNGMFRPLLIEGGRLVAVRPPTQGIIAVQASPSSHLIASLERKIDQMEQRLAS
ncbi:winged helix DNA-binding domain-containing protein [Schaalia vaccimaxillae]|uniref:winged helix DNA-binding domain-containing protein n=1 Tax=Schaalia vaccimaxillae TaxID=183916 RepID=UPI0003B4B358|nr:winged helix DNA-binding domain-containing protein [Schaalia vaccimaxillae]